MTEFVFEREMTIPRPLAEVFPFFADAENLEALTPPWLHFRILTPTPIPMAVGTLIEYEIRFRGMPIRWRTKITDWEPPHRFVDEQLSGPYRQWIHEHTFTETADGTRMKDVVRYAVLGGRLVNRLFVASEVERIFEYRTERLREIFADSKDTLSPTA